LNTPHAFASPFSLSKRHDSYAWSRCFWSVLCLPKLTTLEPEGEISLSTAGESSTCLASYPISKPLMLDGAFHLRQPGMI
jgi:hypothetical protein